MLWDKGSSKANNNANPVIAIRAKCKMAYLHRFR